MSNPDNSMEREPLVSSQEQTQHGAVPELGGIAISAGDAVAIHDPNALASPEAIAEAHSRLSALIDSIPGEFVWDSTPSKGAGDSSVSVNSLRLMSLPAHTDENGRRLGESFVGISYFTDENGKRNIMVTEDKGSANPWGDVLNNAGVIVTKIQRHDTAFTSPTTAEVRKGYFTFGPAELEKAQNASQVNNPFESATARELDRVTEIMESGSVYAHDGQMQLPPNLEDLRTLAIADLIL